MKWNKKNLFHKGRLGGSWGGERGEGREGGGNKGGAGGGVLYEGECGMKGGN